jgi:hypothetical protein
VHLKQLTERGGLELEVLKYHNGTAKAKLESLRKDPELRNTLRDNNGRPRELTLGEGALAAVIPINEEGRVTLRELADWTGAWPSGSSGSFKKALLALWVSQAEAAHTWGQKMPAPPSGPATGGLQAGMALAAPFLLLLLLLLSMFLASSLGGDLLEQLRAQPALQGHKQRAKQERLSQATQQEPLMRQEQEEQQQVPPALSRRSLAALTALISAAWGNIGWVGENWLRGSIFAAIPVKSEATPPHQAISPMRWAKGLLAISVVSFQTPVAPNVAAWLNIDCVGQNRRHGSPLDVWADTSKLWFLAASSLAQPQWAAPVALLAVMSSHRAISLVRWAAELTAKPAVVFLPRAEGPPPAPTADMSVLSSAVSVAIITAEWGNIDCVEQNRLRGPILAMWDDTSKLWFLVAISLALPQWAVLVAPLAAMPTHRAIALGRWAAVLMAVPAVIFLLRAAGPPPAPAADMSVLSTAASVAIIMAEWGISRTTHLFNFLYPCFSNAVISQIQQRYGPHVLRIIANNSS